MGGAFSSRSPGIAVSGLPDTWPLSAREAAALLGVNERTIRRAIARGDLHAEKRGGAFQIARDALDCYQACRQRREIAHSNVRGFIPRLVSEPEVPARPPGSLPRPHTELVGRESAIEAVQGLLKRDDVRLLTLTGAGGVGKTRLALAVADGAGSVNDGVYFIDLAPVQDWVQVGTAITQGLGLRDRSNRPLVQRLTPVLSRRRVLLVLDNFEHVIDAAPLLVDVLAAFPGARILVTSRVRLHLSGEHEYVVVPLALDPPASDPQSPGDAVSAAARLFAARAAALRTDFAITPENADVIGAICRRLDGLPLAIELAAMRVKMLPLQELLERLRQRLPLLTDGARDLPVRQRTMRATIAWSYDLLGSAEQALFRRLSIFVGGFSLVAAERCGDAGPSEGIAVMAGIAALVDASLLHEQAPTGRQPRYLMLETVREFGQEMLDALGETREARDAHAAYFLGLDSWLEPNMVSPGVTIDERVREIEAEHPNINAALTHLDSVGDVRSVLHLTAACAVFWHHRGYLTEGKKWLVSAIAAAPVESTIDRGMALAGLSLLCWTQVEIEAAMMPALEALRIGREIGHLRTTALALHMLALIENVRQQWAEARGHMQEAMALWNTIGERSAVAMSMIAISESELGLGDTVAARRYAEDALQIQRALGHASGAAGAFVCLAYVAEHESDDRRALAAYREALELWAGIGERWAIIKALAGVAGIAAHYGYHDVAARLIGAIDARIDESGGGVFPVDQEHVDRAVIGAREAEGDARFTELRENGRGLSTSDVVALAVSVVVPASCGTARSGVLSRREREVLRLLVDGRSNSEIADELYIGVTTARTHVASILAKLGVSTRTAAATYAIRHRLV